MLELRDYQSDAKAALYDYLRRKDGNPCVVIPTAGGKSICIASVAADAVNVWRGRVLILAHVKELVDQNSEQQGAQGALSRPARRRVFRRT